MKRLILCVLFAFVSLACSSAWGVDDNRYTTKLGEWTCTEFLSAYATSDLKAVKEGYEYNTGKFTVMWGFIAWYLTAVNASTLGKVDWFNKDLIAEVAWIASFCRDHQSKDLPWVLWELANTRTNGVWKSRSC